MLYIVVSETCQNYLKGALNNQLTHVVKLYESKSVVMTQKVQRYSVNTLYSLNINLPSVYLNILPICCLVA
jgi:hypothetical protein